jgi:4-amino-4-deoxy-L-arabinose transferase-like glycosyltransferase
MSKNNRKNLILITILSFVLISSNIGGLYIYALDEAKNSVCAREMLERGDMIVPTFNQELRTDKPPLHYYFMQLAYLIFGVNEFSARFFSVIMGILTVITTWWLATKYLGSRTGLYSSLVLLSSLHFILQFHMAVPDPYLIFLITIGLGLFYVYYQEKKSHYLLLSYVSFGLATLTKGPVAIALPGLSILFFLIVNKNLSWNYFFKLKPLWILGVFLVVILPWYLLVALKTNGEWIREFLLYHNVSRYTNTMEGHGAIFLATPLMVFLGLLPFSIFFIQSFNHGWKRRKESNLLLFCISIILIIVLFFSLSSTKLPNYTVPAYPFLAILIGYYLARLHDTHKNESGYLILTLSVYCLIMLAIPFGLYIGLDMDPVLSNLKNLAMYFIILPFGGIIALLFSIKSKFKGILLSLSLSWILIILLFFYLIFPQIDKINPVARTINKIDPDLPVAAYKIYNPSFSFYIKKPFPEIQNKSELASYVKKNRGYIITRKSYAEDISDFTELKKIAEAKDIFEIPTTVIYQIDHKLSTGQYGLLR